MSNEIRVRFAPSPTGPFHIGGARSALFNWLFARKMGGKLVLRIEDTDLERSSRESEENIKAALKWLGLNWDEGIDVGGEYGPYRQTERLELYKKYTDQLLAEGKAYYCYCTDEELVVIDDALMKISHVIRAEEHLSNTPRQCLIYDALGFTQPTFGHISLILGKDRTKMSKRHGATSVDQYRQLGYLPEGIDNFLALLGWAPNSEQEIFSMEELIQAFSMEHVAKNPAVFEIDKLNWINQHYMRQLDEEAFFAAAKPHMVAAGYMTGDECGEKLEWLKRVVATAKEHVAFAAQIPECVAMYFSDEFEFENAEAAAVLQEESVPTVMNMLFEELPKLEVLDGPAVKAAFKAIQKATKLGGKAVFMPIRVALTGNQHGPELAEMVPLLGLERTEARIRASLAKAGITL